MLGTRDSDISKNLSVHEYLESLALASKDAQGQLYVVIGLLPNSVRVNERNLLFLIGDPIVSLFEPVTLSDPVATVNVVIGKDRVSFKMKLVTSQSLKSYTLVVVDLSFKEIPTKLSKLLS